MLFTSTFSENEEERRHFVQSFRRYRVPVRNHMLFVKIDIFTKEYKHTYSVRKSDSRISILSTRLHITTSLVHLF